MGILIAGTAVLGYAGITLFEWSKESRPQRIKATVTRWMDDIEAAISLTCDGDPENVSLLYVSTFCDFVYGISDNKP